MKKWGKKCKCYTNEDWLRGFSCEKKKSTSNRKRLYGVIENKRGLQSCHDCSDELRDYRADYIDFHARDPTV